MLDVSTASPTRERSISTALVTADGAGAQTGVEVRVWPPEEVWTAARGLDAAGIEWEPALADESGLPGSLVVQPGHTAAEVVAALDLPTVEPLGYLPADERGTCRRLPGAEPSGRDGVVFVELHEGAGRAGRGAPAGWQVRAFGAVPALRRLHAATGDLAPAATQPPRPGESVTLSLADRAGVVEDLVARLDAAGLDGHLRVLRRRSV